MISFNWRIMLIRAVIEINENLIFYPKIRRFYKDLNNNNTFNIVFDIGTNKGQTINQLKKINYDVKIFGFEPNRKHFKNLISKKIHNLKMFQYGCSDREGDLLFHENILDESSTFENINFNSKWLSRKAKILGKKKNDLIRKSYLVKCIKLSKFIGINHIEEIDLIKIDVEGHEFKVLKGLFENNKSLIKYIQFESHKDDLYLEQKSSEINEILKKNGFEHHLSIRHGFGKFYDRIFKHKSLDA